MDKEDEEWASPALSGMNGIQTEVVAERETRHRNNDKWLGGV